jgi:hypothetical protein
MRRLASLSLRQRLLIGVMAAGLLVVLIVVLLLVLTSTTSAADAQPIKFDHHKHVVNDGIQCQFCHAGVTKGPVAGIPSVEFCMGCHANIATDSPEIKKLANYYANHEPVPWVRVYELPDYVYFNHYPHIAAGVSCGSCHGDVANMTVAQRAATINMDFCLDCHVKQENSDVLQDCTVCHR